MANAVYPTFRQALLNGEINLATDNIVCYAVDLADYTYSAAHTVLTDLPAGARVAVTGSLASKTITGGVFDSANPTLPSVTGDAFEALVLYDVTSDNLIAFYDNAEVQETPDGNNIDILVNASGWFAI